MGHEGKSPKDTFHDRYTDKYILAPMVRIGTLPSRLLALRYGADLVYSEEIIDFKMLRTTRVENKLLQTVDYVLADGSVVFRTCKEEKDKVVFQMGTADPERALKTALHVLQDVSAIDVNMGCPKDYSVKGGMGAALLTEPEKVYNILTTLVKGVNKPVTCKIRILPTIEETIKLAKLIEKTGVAAVAVHGREKHERPLQPTHNNVVRAVAEALCIPVIANGGSLDITTHEEMTSFKQDTGCTSVMVARAAQWNLSIFRKEGLLPKLEVIKEYVRTAIDCDNLFSNTKFCVLTLLHDEHTTDLSAKLTACKDIEEMSAVVDLLSYYKSCLEKRALQQAAENEGTSKPQFTVTKRKLNDEEYCEVYEKNIKFFRKNYASTLTPKVVLTNIARKQKLQPPVYESIIEEDTKSFRSTVTHDGIMYTSTEWEKSKKHAEQAAAIVCLQALGIHDGRIKDEL